MTFLRMPTERGSIFAPRFVRGHKAPDAGKARSLPKTTAGFLTRGRFVGKTGSHSQKVAVRVNYKKAGFSDPSAYRKALRANAAYITRDGALDAVDEKGNSLTLDEVHAKTHGWDDDARFYRVIISPEQGHKMDLDKFGADTMAKVREDILTTGELKRGVEVEYIQAQHWDTDHPHVHIMMRAKIEGRELKISAGYFSQGFRSRAEEVATGMLGYRLERDQDRNLTAEQKDGLAKQAVEKNRPLLMARREERGLNPETGKHPNEEAAAKAAAKAIDKTKSRDRGGYDGGME